MLTKVFSGAVSDWLGRRKPLVLLGYGLAALTKPLFPLASRIGMVLTARFVDRIGKGIRDAPRDALVADLTPPALRGAAYGLRQAVDKVGAFAGPLLALVLMAVTGDAFRLAFWVAVIPTVLCVVLIVFGVSESDQPPVAQRRRFPTCLPARLWTLCGQAVGQDLPVTGTLPHLWPDCQGAPRAPSAVNKRMGTAQCCHFSERTDFSSTVCETKRIASLVNQENLQTKNSCVSGHAEGRQAGRIQPGEGTDDFGSRDVHQPHPGPLVREAEGAAMSRANRCSPTAKPSTARPSEMPQGTGRNEGSVWMVSTMRQPCGLRRRLTMACSQDGVLNFLSDMSILSQREISPQLGPCLSNSMPFPVTRTRSPMRTAGGLVCWIVASEPSS